MSLNPGFLVGYRDCQGSLRKPQTRSAEPPPPFEAPKLKMLRRRRHVQIPWPLSICPLLLILIFGLESQSDVCFLQLHKATKRFLSRIVRDGALAPVVESLPDLG
jgi:hypothetical protein